jgi:hypothetical protein
MEFEEVVKARTALPFGAVDGYARIMLRRALPFLVLVSAAFGQINTTNNSVTVTAGPSQTVPPDQVTFAVTIESGLSLSFNDLIAALKGSGLTATNFTNVYSSQQVLVHE